MDPYGYGQPDPMMPDEPEPTTYGPDMGMGDMGETVHYGEVIPFPGSYMPPMDPPHIVELRRRVILLQKLSMLDNAAEMIEPEELSKIGTRVVKEYKIDEDSRRDWRDTAERAMAMARQKKEAKSHPWEGASNVKYPLLTTAALQFAARAYPAIVDGPRIVKCTVLGRDPGGMKAAMADRVSQHMSYQLLYEMPDWEADMDTALHQIPVVGCAFKKVYPDGTRESGFCSDLISAFDFVVHQRTKTLETVPRATHVFPLYPHEIADRIRAGKFAEFDYKGGSDEGSEDDDAPHIFLEQHRYLDLDGDGVEEPWIVTVHKKLQKVCRIKPGFDIDKIVLDQERGQIIRIPRKSYFVKLPFIPDPEGGFYDVGFGKLLEATNDVIDTTINQMMDAGTLQNSGGGFVGAGLNLSKSQIRLQPGVFKTVQNTGDDIRKSIVQMEHPGPSKVLFDVLSLMIEAGKDIAAVKDVLTGDTPTNQTATSTMAAIEQGLKVFTAIYKRIFRALQTEYRMIYAINREFMSGPKYIKLMDEPVEVLQSDYHDELDVMPVADPNTVTDMQRMAKAQFLMEMVAAGNPHINPMEATKRALEAARIDRIQDVLTEPPPPDPLQLEGAKAEVDKIKADVAKTVADTEVQLATVGLPIGLPVQVAEPVFTQQADPMMPQGPMPGAPPPTPPMDMGAPEMSPEEMQMLALQMGGGEPPRPETSYVAPGLQG